MNRVQATDLNVVFIGGTNKAGSTSLFEYLSRHPAIHPSSVKQTRYFLEGEDSDLSREDFVRSNYGLQLDIGVEYLLEGTPDYLASPLAAERILRLLERDGARFVFILRDPVDRMVSWFKYGKQLGEVSETESFERFVQKNIDGTHAAEPYTALQTGMYAPQVKVYRDLFGAQNVLLVDFSNLISKPEDTIRDILGFLRLDSTSLQRAGLKHVNQSVATRSRVVLEMYRLLRRAGLWLKRNARMLDFIMDPLFRASRGVYRRINTRAVDAAEMSPALRASLASKFHEDAATLRDVYGFNSSWGRDE